MADWISPTGFNDPDNKWTDEEKAYDEDTATFAQVDRVSDAWSAFVELTHPGIIGTKLRFFAYHHATASSEIDVDVYYDGGWHDVYSGSFTSEVWVEKDILGGAQAVTKARVRFYCVGAGTANHFLYEFDFYGEAIIPKSSSDAGQGQDSAVTLWKGTEDKDAFATDAGSGVDAVAVVDKEVLASDSGTAIDSMAALIKPPLAPYLVYLTFFVEKFTGTKAYNRPFWSHSIENSAFLSNLWREPVPFNLESQYGLAISHHGEYCWLSSPSGVWRAPLTVETVNISGDILTLRQKTGEESGKLTVELRNDDGRYASLPSPLELGCQLEFSPGYVTSQGNEVSSGQAFWLESYEYITAGGKASLILYGWDAWTWLSEWRARHQFRWNKASQEMNVKQILEFVLARVGLKLEVKSQSSVITSYYPDFAIHPNTSGEMIIRRLLSFVPDVLLIEGNKAYLVNPQSGNSSVYSYGSAHPIFEGEYREGAQELNRIQVEGYNPANGKPIIVDSFDWDEIGRVYDRLSQVEDRNIDTVAKAEQRGEAHLRQAEIDSVSGAIRIPPNCGQQLYDVIDITDSRAGLSAQKKRVLGLILVYEPRRGKYEQRLLLGAV